MTADEFKAAREALGVTQVQFAEAFKVSARSVGGWERGHRNGRKHPVPPIVARFVTIALAHPMVRRELGINS